MLTYLWLMTHDILNKTPKIESDFQKFIDQADFPCLGAKSALARDQIHFYTADDIKTATSDAKIVKELQLFSSHTSAESVFVSFVVLFENSPSMDETDYERYLWKRLQAMHELDAIDYGWDKNVSSDPASAQFSMSIGGKAFYIVGLHPEASRPARRFYRPAMIFNLHSQFELLRDEGRYLRIREKILKRDMEVAGSINPVLATHGEISEARQYSGRNVENGWKCPFHAKDTAQ